jgi:hypothetical protein
MDDVWKVLYRKNWAQKWTEEAEALFLAAWWWWRRRRGEKCRCGRGDSRFEHKHCNNSKHSSTLVMESSVPPAP